jgi:3-dehydroquinate synthase
MRWAVMTAVLVAVVIGSKLLLENLLGVDTEAMATAWLSSAGAGSALVIVGLLAADVFLPVPSSVVMVLSGAAFGVTRGALLALVGSVLVEWLGFELVRRYGRGLAARIVGDDDIARFSRFFERHGAMAVIVTRPLPVVMETMSVVAGLAGMRRGTFLAASVIGTLPIVVLYAYAGSVSKQIGSVLPAAVILAALGGAGWLAYRGR